MAITRAQIAKQLLAQGGRIGLQGGGRDAGKDSDFGQEDFGGPKGGGGDGDRNRIQTEKQRESSLIADRKFLKRIPLAEKRYDIKVNSEFSQNVMMNRYMMKTANFNTLNTIPDYANSMSEVINKHYPKAA